MNKTIGLQLLVYSFITAGLSYLTYHLAPGIAKPTLIAGLAGGALCLVWSIRAISGHAGKSLAILTLIGLNFVLLTQAVVAWGGDSQQAPRQAAGVITLLLVLSVAMLMRIAYAGLFAAGQRPQ